MPWAETAQPSPLRQPTEGAFLILPARRQASLQFLTFCDRMTIYAENEEKAGFD